MVEESGALQGQGRGSVTELRLQGDRLNAFDQRSTRAQASFLQSLLVLSTPRQRPACDRRWSSDWPACALLLQQHAVERVLHLQAQGKIAPCPATRERLERQLTRTHPGQFPALSPSSLGCLISAGYVGCFRPVLDRPKHRQTRRSLGKQALQHCTINLQQRQSPHPAEPLKFGSPKHQTECSRLPTRP